MHFNSLDAHDLRETLRSANLPHVSMEVKGEHGSRTHRTAFDVRLTGDGTSNRRRTQDNQDYAASYSEWGTFIAHLFDREPNAHIGPYVDRVDFHYVTKGEFYG